MAALLPDSQPDRQSVRAAFHHDSTASTQGPAQSRAPCVNTRVPHLWVLAQLSPEVACSALDMTDQIKVGEAEELVLLRQRAWPQNSITVSQRTTRLVHVHGRNMSTQPRGLGCCRGARSAESVTAVRLHRTSVARW